MSNGALIVLMCLLFLGLGYAGVPVAFALIAGVLVATAFTPVSFPSMIGQLFHGIDSETLLAVPFFLLVGELMTSADVTHRMIRLSQTLVGHLRGGLAQVVTLFSMFFAGISGSSTADVAVLSRTVAPEMDREGYDRAFTAALIASASTMANLIPPSIMAVVYGATGNVSIGGLFLGGIVPGLVVGMGLMVYSHFFGPVGVKKQRAGLGEIGEAARGAALPLVIPIIILGGILTGWFTPTEAGMIASVYILFVVIPLIRPGHIRRLPADFMYTGMLYAIPLAAVAGASAFGWMLAYLRGPDVIAGYILAWAGADPAKIMFLLVVLFVVLGDFIDAVPAIIIFMPVINKLTEVGRDQSGAHGRGAHHDPRVRAHHAALRAVAPGGVEVRGGAVRTRDAPVAPALRRLLRDDRLRGPLSEGRALPAEDVPARVRRLLPKPERDRLHLPALSDARR